MTYKIRPVFACRRCQYGILGHILCRPASAPPSRICQQTTRAQLLSILGWRAWVSPASPCINRQAGQGLPSWCLECLGVRWLGTCPWHAVRSPRRDLNWQGARSKARKIRCEDWQPDSVAASVRLLIRLCSAQAARARALSVPCLQCSPPGPPLPFTSRLKSCCA